MTPQFACYQITRRLLAATAACVLCGAAAFAVPGRAAEFSSLATFNASVQQRWVVIVPRSLIRMEVVLEGASGGPGRDYSDVARPGKGGVGGKLSFTLRIGHGIRAGDTLELWVGADGKWVDHRGPLIGGRGGADGGGNGGDGTGIFDVTSGRWLAIAAGGGGGGGVGGGGFDPGGAGGQANQAGQSTAFAAGGSARSVCPPAGPGSLPLSGGAGGAAAKYPYGSGGGGGGGCAAGGGGESGKGSGGTGGAGGRDWAFQNAFSVSYGTAPAGDGRIVIQTVTYHEPPPQITSPAHVDLVEGVPADFDVTTIGKPPPDMTVVRGSFPAGITFRVGLFEGLGRLRGTPAPGSAGTYQVLIAIRNDWGAEDQMLRITVHPRP